MSLPNQITIFRILIIPVFIGLLLYYDDSARLGEVVEAYRIWAFVLFILAAVSDGIDGFIARRFKQRSEFGAVMDPLADKCLLLSAIITLAYIKGPWLFNLPLWFLILVLSRDAILIIGFICLHLFARNYKVRPHWTGKGSTVAQMMVVSMILLRFDEAWIRPVLYVGGALLVASLGVYLWRGFIYAQVSGYTHAVERKKE